jgi:hypothetical protein
MRKLKFIFVSLVVLFAIGQSNKLSAQNETPEQLRTGYEDSLREAQDSAIKDSSGKITRFEIKPLFESQKQLNLNMRIMMFHMRLTQTERGLE